MAAPENPIKDGIHSGVLDAETIRSSTLYNEDLAPIPASRRSWSTYNYAALWIAMSVNIPTYMLASGMIAGGMSWRQGIFTVFLGNVLVLAPMLLNAHAGAKYGIPFPVFARAVVIQDTYLYSSSPLARQTQAGEWRMTVLRALSSRPDDGLSGLSACSSHSCVK